MPPFSPPCYTKHMKILVTNDDGITAPSLWALVAELHKIADVFVVAPDKERSAIGTAVTLFNPLHVQAFASPVKGVTAYAADGTPGDCVILAHGKLVKGLDMVVSGINPGLNFGEDVYISGTVGAAMQGYFRGLPALAVSAYPGSQTALSTGAGVAAALVQKMAAEGFPRIFLNLNIPDVPLEKINSVRITRLARSSHINTVTEDNRGELKQYRLVRERLAEAGSDGTDIQAIMQGHISLTPLYTSLLDKPPQPLLKKLAASLLNDVKKV